MLLVFIDPSSLFYKYQLAEHLHTQYVYRLPSSPFSLNTSADQMHDRKINQLPDPKRTTLSGIAAGSQAIGNVYGSGRYIV